MSGCVCVYDILPTAVLLPSKKLSKRTDPNWAPWWVPNGCHLSECLQAKWSISRASSGVALASVGEPLVRAPTPAMPSPTVCSNQLANLSRAH